MLVRYESKKLLTFSVFLLIVLAFGVKLIAIRSSATSIETNAVSEKYYITYLHQFEGELTKDKEEYIQRLKTFFETTLDAEQTQKQAYINNEITKDEYDIYLGNLTYCRQRSESFNRLYNDYMYIKMARIQNPIGAEPEFLYKGYWEKLLSPYSFDFILTLLIVILVVNIVTSEYSGEMIPLLHSSVRGRIDTLYAKMVTGGAVVFIISLIFALTELLIYYNMSYLPNADATIQSLGYFTGFSFNLSLRAFAIIVVIMKSISATLISQVLILIGYLIRKRNALLVAMIIILFVPLFISTVLPAVYAFLPASILNFYNVIRYVSVNPVIGLQFVLPICIYGLYAVIIWLLMKKVESTLLLKANKGNIEYKKH